MKCIEKMNAMITRFHNVYSFQQLPVQQMKARGDNTFTLCPRVHEKSPSHNETVISIEINA